MVKSVTEMEWSEIKEILSEAFVTVSLWFDYRNHYGDQYCELSSLFISNRCPKSESLSRDRKITCQKIRTWANIIDIFTTISALETHVLFRCSLLINVGFCQVLWYINTPISVRNWKWKSGENLEFTKKNLWPAQIYTRNNCPSNENLLVHT